VKSARKGGGTLQYLCGGKKGRVLHNWKKSTRNGGTKRTTKPRKAARLDKEEGKGHRRCLLIQGRFSLISLEEFRWFTWGGSLWKMSNSWRKGKTAVLGFHLSGKGGNWRKFCEKRTVR